MLTRLDAAIIRQATRFAHRFQRLTGKSSFWLAKCGYQCAALAIVLFFFNRWLPLFSRRSYLLEILGTPLTAFAAVHFACLCDEADADLAEGVTTLPGFVLRSREAAWLRLCLVGIFALQVGLTLVAHKSIETLAMAIVGGMLFGEYFLCVDPLPPGTSQIREWLNGCQRQPLPVRIES